jgi:hypothetical protein
MLGEIFCSKLEAAPFCLELTKSFGYACAELAMLQSKFEQDKKRIQQLRAQRKFKPY